MDSLHIIDFITNYGYLAILIGSLFEGETLLIIAGLAVHQGLLDLPLVFLCSLIGTVVGDNSFFFLGRYKGHQLVAKYKFFNKLTTVSEKISGKRAPYLSFAMRFMYGFRHLMPFGLGMSDIKTRVFMFFNFLGGLSWVLVAGFAGYFFGDILEIFFGRLKHYGFRVAVITLIVVVCGSVMYRIFRRGLKDFIRD